jgi:hypothetical protein
MHAKLQGGASTSRPPDPFGSDSDIDGGTHRRISFVEETELFAFYSRASRPGATGNELVTG